MLHPRFTVELGDDTCIAGFDADGYAGMKGNVYPDATSGQLTPTTDPEFIIKAGSSVVALFDENGLYLKGNLYELVTIDLDQITSPKCFRIKDHNGDTIAMINAQDFNDSDIEEESPYLVPAGSLILKQRLVACNLIHDPPIHSW